MDPTDRSQYTDERLDAMTDGELRDTCRVMGLSLGSTSESREPKLRRIRACRDRVLDLNTRPPTQPGRWVWRERMFIGGLFLLTIGSASLVVWVSWKAVRGVIWLSYEGPRRYQYVESRGVWANRVAVFALVFFLLAGVWWLKTRLGLIDDDQDYLDVDLYYREDESQFRSISAPEFPSSAQRYAEMSKKFVLRELARAIQFGLRLERDIEQRMREAVTKQERERIVLPDQTSEPNAPRPPTPTLPPPSIKEEEVRRLCTACDSLRKQLQTLESDIAAKDADQKAVTQGQEDAVAKIETERSALQELLDEKLNALAEARTQLEAAETKVKDAETRAKDAETRADTWKIERDRAQGELFRIRSKVWIFFRFRPFSPRVDGAQARSPLDLTTGPNDPDYHHSLILRGKDFDAPKESVSRRHSIVGDQKIEVDRVIHEDESTASLYEHLKPMVQAALDGLDALFVFEGPSGSGKTHTMFGTEPQYDGIASMIAEHIFSPPSGNGETPSEIEVKLTNLKMYRNTLMEANYPDKEYAKRQLHLKKRNGAVRVCHDKAGEHEVTGVTVTTKKQLVNAFIKVCKRRRQRPTAQNNDSSRSHAICQLEITRKASGAGEAVRSSLFLLDLAGAESMKDSATPEETLGITKPRGNLLHAMKETKKLHCMKPESPLRAAGLDILKSRLKDETLTHLLQSCFFGDPKIVLVANADPYVPKEHWHRIRETIEFVNAVGSDS